MNPLIAKFAGAAIRSGLILLVPTLQKWGWVTLEDAELYIGTLTAWLLVLGWSWYEKWRSRAILVNALSAPAGSSEDHVTAMATPPVVAQKVLAVLLSVGMIGSMLACASRGPIHLQVASYGAEMTRIAVQAQTAVLEADKSGLQPNKELTRKAMEAFRQLGGGIGKLATALEAYDVMVPADQVANVPKIEVLLAEARRLVRAALLFGGAQTEALGGELLKLFDNLDSVFQQVQTTLRPVGA